MPELWYRRFGFYSNPFSIKPAAFHNEIIGHNIKDIYEDIKEGKVLLIEGDYGLGKTTLLKQIISRFRGHKKLIYYNASIAEKSLDLPELLYGSLSFLDKLLGREAKGMLLLIDEAQFLTAQDYDHLAEYYDNGLIKSIVLAGFDFNEKALTARFKKLLAGNRIKLGMLRPNQAVQLVRKRIGELSALPDSMIKKIYSVSENPRTLLENCEDALRYASEENGDVVTPSHIKKLLKKRRLAVKARKKKAKKHQVKPEIKPAEEPPAVFEDTGQKLLNNVYEEQ